MADGVAAAAFVFERTAAGARGVAIAQAEALMMRQMQSQ